MRAHHLHGVDFSILLFRADRCRHQHERYGWPAARFDAIGQGRPPPAVGAAASQRIGRDRSPSARESFRQVRLNMRRAGVPMLLVTRRPAIRDEPIAPTADTILRKVGRVAGSDRSWMTAVGDEAGTKSQAFKRELHGGGLVPSRAPRGRRRSPTRTAATRTWSGRTTGSSAGAWAKLVRSKAGLHMRVARSRPARLPAWRAAFHSRATRPHSGRP